MKSRIAILAAFAGLILAACDSSTNAPTNGTTNPPAAGLVVDQEQAINVAIGATVTYTFVAGAQSGYQISTTTSSTTTGLVVTLYDSTGRQLDQTTSVKSYLTYRNTGGSPATYTVTLKNTGASAVGTLLRLTQTDGPDKYEPDNSRAEATLIRTDSTVQGHILQTGEDDWYKFDVLAGRGYRVVVSSSFSGESYLYADSTSITQTYSSSSSFSIKPTKSGRMFLDFSGYSSTSSGAYKIAIYLDTVGFDKYEPDDTRAQATLITTDSVAQSHYLQAGEDDWFKFDAQLGKSYRITVTSTFTGESYVYPDSTTSTYQTSNTSSSFTVKAVKSARMFFDFSGYSSSYSGAYRISVSVDTTGIDKYEPDDTRAQATLITTDSVAQTHYLQASEHDWLKFKADSGKTYKVTVGNFSNGEFYFYRDSTSTSYNSYYYTSGSIKALKTGEIFVDFTGYSSSASGAYRISVSVDTTGRDKYEPDDLRAQAGLITTDGLAQSHFIQLADTDWVKFHVDSGSTYLLSTSGTTSTYIHLYPDSTSLSYSTGSTSVSLKAVKSGTYFANIAGYSSTSTGAYSVSVTTTGPDKYEPDDTKATASNIVVDSAAQTHNLVAGEHDWVKFDASTGLTYTILVVNNTNGSWTFDYDLYDSAASTTYLATGETGYTGISYTPTASGTFYLDIHGLSTSSTGTYSVIVTSK